MAKGKKQEAATEGQTLHYILDNLPGIVILHAPDRSIRFVNRYFRNIFGDPGDRSCHEILHMRNEPCDECHPFRIFSTGSPIEWEVTSRHGRTYQMYASPLSDSDGSPLVLELGIDVTDRKRGEVRLKGLQDCFLGFGPDPNENINRLTAVVGEFLGATCSLYNRLEGDLLHSWGMWNAPPDFNPVDRAEGHICHDVIRLTLGDVLVLRNLQESRYAQTDPNVVRYGLQSYIGQAVEFGGKFVGSLCAVFQRDYVPCEGDKELMRAIAKAIGVEEERRRATEALRESDERYRELVELLPQSVFEMDARGKLTFANRYVLDNFGYTQDDLMNAPGILTFFVPEDRDRAGESIRRTLNGETMGGEEYTLLRKDGGKVPVIIYSNPIVRNNETVGIRGVFVDITGRKSADEERERLQVQLQLAMKLEAVGRLAGGVAHDFNNLLTTIIGNVYMAQVKISPSDPAAGFLAEVKNAAERAAALTQQLLAFSRKQIIKPKITDLNELVKGLHTMLFRLIGEKIELKIIPGADLGLVKVDPSQIEQVLANLALNSRDAMPEGGKILIETANADLDEEYCGRNPHVRRGRFVMLAVSDTGHGMGEEVKKRIFEPFFSTKPKGTGTGLGLATIYGVVNQSEGFIEVYSEVGKGTSFKIYLPRVEDQAAIPRESDLQMKLLEGSETIFLVENEKSVRYLCVRILEGLGYKVIQASNGDEAIAAACAHKGRIDLLITDVVMPGMNGGELAEKLVIHHPEMKVLFMSGYTEEAIVHHGVLDDGVSFIGKPYSPSAFLRKIREVLYNT